MAEHIIYRQNRSTFIILRQMVGGQFVKVATTYDQRDAELVKEAFHARSTAA